MKADPRWQRFKYFLLLDMLGMSDLDWDGRMGTPLTLFIRSLELKPDACLRIIAASCNDRAALLHKFLDWFGSNGRLALASALVTGEVDLVGGELSLKAAPRLLQNLYKFYFSAHYKSGRSMSPLSRSLFHDGLGMDYCGTTLLEPENSLGGPLVPTLHNDRLMRDLIVSIQYYGSDAHE